MVCGAVVGGIVGSKIEASVVVGKTEKDDFMV